MDGSPPPTHLLHDLQTLRTHWTQLGCEFAQEVQPARYLPPHFRLTISQVFYYGDYTYTLILDQHGLVKLSAWLEDDGGPTMKTVFRPPELTLLHPFFDPVMPSLAGAGSYVADWENRREHALHADLNAEQRQAALRDLHRQKVRLQKQLDQLQAIEQGHREALNADLILDGDE